MGTVLPAGKHAASKLHRTDKADKQTSGCACALQAGKQVVPVLLSMSGVGNASQVRGMALDALGEVWRSAAADAKVCGQLSSHFEALLDTKDHEVMCISLATAAQIGKLYVAAWAACVWASAIDAGWPCQFIYALAR